MTTDSKKEAYKKEVRSVSDAMYVLGGKWKIPIISALCYFNKRRFSDIVADVNGISNKMLSKELKELELNTIVQRTVLNGQPPIVEYELTDYGRNLQNVINSLSDWGATHKKVITGK